MTGEGAGLFLGVTTMIARIKRGEHEGVLQTPEPEKAEGAQRPKIKADKSRLQFASDLRTETCLG
jgi:hypothetical protein